jgi:outer membrane protein assembly factor BamB
MASRRPPRRRPPRRRRSQRNRARWILFGGLGALIVAVIVVGIIYETGKPHNVSNSNVPFHSTPSDTPTVTTTAADAMNAILSKFSWPMYGYTEARTRDFTTFANVRPPFTNGWKKGGNALLEFSPSIQGKALYYMDDGATVKKISSKSGYQFWDTHLGTLAAATPALDPKDNLLFVPTLSTSGDEPGDGEFAALSMTKGKVMWTIPIASGSESSPLYSDGVVYFGTQAGAVYAVDATTGKIKWTFQADDSVKGGVALSGGLLYFGSYGDEVYAVNPATGKEVWSASGGGSLDSGTFYATPAVAYGRVYIGNTNGYVYSFDAKTGALAWSRGTGAYVYGAASVANVPGLGPTVYVGSYSGYFYALNAQTGAVRWDYDDGARISGASTVVNNVVYFSDFDYRSTGLNARTGKKIFTFPDGGYTPVVATPNAIYLDGRYTMYELLPKLKLSASALKGK